MLNYKKENPLYGDGDSDGRTNLNSSCGVVLVVVTTVAPHRLFILFTDLPHP